MLKQFTDKYGDDVYVDPSSVTAVYTDWCVMESPVRIMYGTMILIGSERLFVKEHANEVAEAML